MSAVVLGGPYNKHLVNREFRARNAIVGTQVRGNPQCLLVALLSYEVLASGAMGGFWWVLFTHYKFLYCIIRHLANSLMLTARERNA